VFQLKQVRLDHLALLRTQGFDCHRITISFHFLASFSLICQVLFKSLAESQSNQGNLWKENPLVYVGTELREACQAAVDTVWLRVWLDHLLQEEVCVAHFELVLLMEPRD